MSQQAPETVWTPGADVTQTQIAEFARQASVIAGRDLSTYTELWRWSITELEQFWSLVWTFFDVTSDTPYAEVLSDRQLPGARWFGGATLNYAEHALRGDEGATALVEVDESGKFVQTTLAALRAEVAGMAAALRNVGVSSGDRVVGYLPNSRTAVVAFLACASMGAVWSCCAQDYGASAAADRFAQLEPMVLVSADGYVFAGKTADRRAATAELVAHLPSLRQVIHVSHVGLGEPTPISVPSLAWSDVVETPAELIIENVPADHPLWALFSSGTTGKPKAIVHGHGGVLLEHLKSLGLHLDLRAGETLFWYTSTNWMMWNLNVSGLLMGATVVLYDGSPTYPGPDRLWQVVEDTHASIFGTSPGFLLASEKAGLRPGEQHDLSGLRGIGSTGSTLHQSAYTWVHDVVSPRVQLNSTSGGTDMVCAFVGCAPNLPVVVGEISGPMLGVALAAYNPDGRSVRGEVGELVITEPMPSMPLRFWNDPDGRRYYEAYFDTY
ncbi:MAG: acetoacetate--CoA ligase, partial [Mycobacteriaceae bacterium]